LGGRQWLKSGEELHKDLNRKKEKGKGALPAGICAAWVWPGFGGSSRGCDQAGEVLV